MNCLLFNRLIIIIFLFISTQFFFFIFKLQSSSNLWFLFPFFQCYLLSLYFSLFNPHQISSLLALFYTGWQTIRIWLLITNWEFRFQSLDIFILLAKAAINERILVFKGHGVSHQTLSLCRLKHGCCPVQLEHFFFLLIVCSVFEIEVK